MYYIPPGSPYLFPEPDMADSDGLLCIGGGLEPDRILYAYSLGIFPWYNPGEPILWWSPDPRCVLFPEDIRITKSMRSYFNQNRFQVTYNIVFEDVISQCAFAKRTNQAGTWLTLEMQEAYISLHKEGWAHSVEVWDGTDLVGGLYGISFGGVFFGESMFSHADNASKYGFISLVKKLTALGFKLIDCQQRTTHLLSLGACTIPRGQFMEILRDNPIERTTL